MNPGTADKPRSGFRSAFSHTTEVAEADYYKVKLEDYNVLAELTTSTRVGMHQYTFPAADQAHIILDLVSGIYNYEDKNVWTFIRVENDTLITGYRQTNGWARSRTEYFALSFSKPFYQYGSRNYSKRQVYRGFWGKFDQNHNFPDIAGKQIRMHFDFATKEGEKIKIKFALSPVSTENRYRCDFGGDDTFVLNGERIFHVLAGTRLAGAGMDVGTRVSAMPKRFASSG